MVKRLLVLNGLAVLGAVANHATGWGFTAMFWWPDAHQGGPAPDFSQVGSPSYYALRAIEQLIIFAIPAFLFVSGFFVAFAAGRAKGRLGYRVIGSRIKTLLIPYLFWSTVILAGRALEGNIYSTAGYLNRLIFGGAAPPYYYVPLLIQFFLLAPWIVEGVRRFPRLSLAAAGLIQAAALMARYPVALGWELPLAEWIVFFTPGWFIAQTALWFTLGAYAGLRPSAFNMWLKRRRIMILATAAVSLIVAIVEWEWLFRASGQEWLAPANTLLDGVYAGAVLLAFLAWPHLTPPFSNVLKELGIRSFGIYLVHAPVLELVSRAAYHYWPWALGHQMVLQPALILSGVGVAVLLMFLVARSPARSNYQYIFG